MILYGSLLAYKLIVSMEDTNLKGVCVLDEVQDRRCHLAVADHVYDNSQERDDVRRRPSIQDNVKLSRISLLELLVFFFRMKRYKMHVEHFHNILPCQEEHLLNVPRDRLR